MKPNCKKDSNLCHSEFIEADGGIVCKIHIPEFVHKLQDEVDLLVEVLKQIGFTRCEFDGDCDHCDKAELGSFAIGLGAMPEYPDEVDSYICGKCIVIKYRSR